MKKLQDPRYNYYAESVAQVLAESELIFEDEVQEMAAYIRGCS